MFTEEQLKILVPLFTAVLVAFITYYFTRSHYERKRKDDLADREFSRRAAIHDRRIREAREYVDKWNNLLFEINEINSKALGAISVDDIRQALDMKRYNQLMLLLEAVTKQLDILHILNDEELLDWHKKFLPRLLPLIRYLLESIKKVTLSNKLDIDKNMLMELSKLHMISVVAIARMKYKLDELAKKVL